jgi:hypothetical protein
MPIMRRYLLEGLQVERVNDQETISKPYTAIIYAESDEHAQEIAEADDTIVARRLGRIESIPVSEKSRRTEKQTPILATRDG